MHNTIPNSPLLPAVLLCFIFMAACSSSRTSSEPVPTTDETAELLRYLEENGDLINSPYLPSLINASDLYGSLHGRNIHVIDLRPADQYRAGHIAHSINVHPPQILDHFERTIDPEGFEFIVLVCPDAMLSTYVNSVLLMLGYDNVYSLRFGLSSWDRQIAAEHWLRATSDLLLDNLEQSPNPKNESGELPAIGTGEQVPYRILRARAQKVLEVTRESINKPIHDLLEDPGDYYIINYWPEILYNRGHLTGAVQYSPKASLHSNADLSTLPVDRPVITYCFTGHHSGYVTAFLRLLGYDAYNLPYGANAFIHTTMRTDHGGLRTFTEDSVYHFPLEGDGAQQGSPEEPAGTRVDQEPVTGGC